MKLTALFLAALLGAATAEDKTPADAPKTAEPATPAEPAEAAKPGEPAKPAEAAKPAEPPAPPAGEPKIFAPTDLTALKPLVGQKVTIEGTIVADGVNKPGTIRYLNFTKEYSKSVALVFFANLGEGKFTKEKLAEYLNKKVRVNATLEEYKSALQLKIESIDQLKIQE